MFAKSRTFYMKAGDKRKEQIHGLSKLSRLGMKRYLSQITGQPAPEVEEISKDRAYELMMIRNKAELEVIQGLKSA